MEIETIDQAVENETSIEIAFGLILHAGNSRSSSIRAVRAAEQGEFDEANKLLVEADAEMRDAHDIQTKMLQDEMKGSVLQLSLAMVHAQDHLSMATVQRESAGQIVQLYREIRELRVLVEDALNRTND